MAKQSAGLLLYKTTPTGLRVLIVHPGGPFWARKDAGAWSIPKGEFLEGEEALTAAKREFREELGMAAPESGVRELGSAKQSSGKIVYAWACEGDLDVKKVRSNTFMMEWPPKSGKEQAFPEVDRARWCSLEEARLKLVKAQVVFLERLAEQLGTDLPDIPEQASLF
jgi:predicted NUDIX family NTP pyrophosphohydrolase